MPLREMSEAEAAYVAGIIDGEGTLTLTRRHRGAGRTPVVSISSTELPLLQYIRSVVGGGRITIKVAARDCHSPSFAFAISSRQALALLAQVSKYLRTYKLQRCRLLLDEYLDTDTEERPLHLRSAGCKRTILGALLHAFHARRNQPWPSLIERRR